MEKEKGKKLKKFPLVGTQYLVKFSCYFQGKRKYGKFISQEPMQKL